MQTPGIVGALLPCEIEMGSSEFVLGEFSCLEMASEVILVSRCPVIVDPDVMAKCDNPVDGRCLVKSSLLSCSALMRLSQMQGLQPTAMVGCL